ncbi:MAG: EcsC family protein [Paracoccaceae bacterium]
MTGTALIPVHVSTELDALALRYRRAGGVGLEVLNLLGGQAENLLERLPARIKDQMEDATGRALQVALRAAADSRGRLPDQSAGVNTGIAAVMGAAGGFGGLPTALAELPLTTTMLLRAILGVAARHGFDPADPAVQQDCLTVFAAAGPLAEDDGAEMGFLAARVTLTGATLRGLIARVAPRFSAVLGQKLAAQTVPILGAAAGAATNYAYTRYYQEIAHVHFGLRRLALDSGADPATLARELRARMQRR